MATGNTSQESTTPPVVVLERSELLHDKSVRVVRSTIRYQQSDGAMSEPITRIAVIPGDAVAVLAYDPNADVILLVRQFRYPVYDRLPADASDDTARQEAWLLEVVAGKVDDGETVEETARRELREETGYEVTAPLEQIAVVYSSPGTYAERITIFLARIDRAAAHGPGGGKDAGEDTAIVEMPLDEALTKLERGSFRDAKTVIALQHLALKRAKGTRGAA